jgi:NADP-dependent 3-hydroxy acid dehydrogenase YdfG
MSGLQRNGSALITGASTGIGAVYAARLARRGYDLILVSRDKERLNQLGKEIATKAGRRADARLADLTVKGDVLRIEDRLRSEINRPDCSKRATEWIQPGGINRSAACLAHQARGRCSSHQVRG